MVHTYIISGMTCSSCEANIKDALLKLPAINAVEVSRHNNTATIIMDKHVSVQQLQAALPAKYQITEETSHTASEVTSSWFDTYKPVLLIFLYITVITFLIQLSNTSVDIMQWMRHFMAAFFLVFSFFKFLNLEGFANSYRMYDVLAKRVPAWAYVYVFVELALGVAYLINFAPYFTNVVTLVVMGVSIVGVLQSVLNKKTIQCACLGTVFQLPMSTITIVEDALMIAMSAAMLVL
jgi:copper chaperone CopZ